MWICNDCGNVFDDHDVRKTYHADPLYVETEYVCPSCKSSDTEEAVKCVSCGEYFTEKEIIGEHCVDCLKNEVEEMDWRTFADFLDFLDVEVSELSDYLEWRKRKNAAVE